MLRIEWLKLKNYRTFWILSALYVLGIGGINYTVYSVQQTASSKEPLAREALGTPYAFPGVWGMTSYVASFLHFLPGLLIILLITNEFSFRTHRQNIIDGVSRRQFISAKLALGVIISAVATIATFLTALIFGFTQSGAFSSEGLHYIGYFFLQALSYTGMAILIALLVRRSGLAIGIFFLYTLIFDELLAALLKRFASGSGYFAPLEAPDVLIPLPIGKETVEGYVTRPDAQWLLLATGIYLIIYYVASRKRFLSMDL